MSLKKNLLALFIIFLGLSLVAGCGYTTRSAIKIPWTTIYVTQFKNSIDYTNEFNEARNIKTYFPLIETKITSEVVNRFMFDGNLKVVREDNAEITLKGELIDYLRDVLRYDDNNNPLEYRISLVVKLSLWDNKENKLLWEESRFAGDTTYVASGTSAKSEAAAINDAVVDLARRIVERIVEAW